MDLYYAPLACSMATRIVLYETAADATFIGVNTRTKRLTDGSDFYAINPMGQVPVLRTDAGELLMENPVVLQYVADRNPASGLAPQGGIERYRLQQWLNFITSELHKVVFVPLLDPQSNDGAKEYARLKLATRLRYVNDHLVGRDWLLDRFTVADAYLVTVLNWAGYTGTDLAPWPALAAYFRAACDRPSIARAMADELAAFREEQARHKAT